MLKEYSKNNICGTMKSVPTGTVQYTDNNSNNDSDIVISETSRVIPELNVMLEYDSAMLEYDHEITEAMNFITNL